MVLLASVMPPTEGVCLTQLNTELNVANRGHGNGTLYITENVVRWVSDAGLGIDLTYPSIVLHAISTKPSSFPQPCLYLQLEGKLDDEGSDSGQSSGGEDRDFEAHTTDVRFIPQESNDLALMYGTMCDCQALHPDPEDSLSGEDEIGEGDGEFFTNPEDMQNLNDQGLSNLARLEAMLAGGDNTGEQLTNGTNGNHADEGMDVDDGQFEDADGNQR